VKTLARLVRLAGTAQLWLAAAIFAACIALYAVEIAMRLLFHGGFPDYFEIIGISFLYVFLLGAAALYARDEDIIIDFLYLKAPPAVQAWWLLGVHCIVAVTVAVTAVVTWRLIVLQSAVPTPLLRIPESVRWVPLLIATGSILLTATARAVACAVWIRSGQVPDLLRLPQTTEEREEIL
jgi:TRAP-type C4-dicarboxylate transport system permease small subunit